MEMEQTEKGKGRQWSTMLSSNFPHDQSPVTDNSYVTIDTWDHKTERLETIWNPRMQQGAHKEVNGNSSASVGDTAV